MNNKLEVLYKPTFGNDLCYPINDIAKNICRIAGDNSITDRVRSLIEDMGYVIEPVAYEPSNPEHKNIKNWNKPYCYRGI